MHGYAKTKLVNSSRSKSLDLVNLLSFPHTQKPNEKISPNYIISETEKPKEIENIRVRKNTSYDDHFSSEMEEEDGKVKKFSNMKLSRNSSISSTAFDRLRLDRQSSKIAIQTALKRAFSVSRSSSVSEKYCRIHDQYDDAPSSPLKDEVEGMGDDAMQTRSIEKRQKKNGGVRILKACKRLFGL